MSTGMTAVKSLSFAQRKSEQNKIVIAKAGYHRGDGILPFVLRDQGRFVRTWPFPYMARLGVVAAYARTQENGKISLYRGCSFIGEYGILGLVQQILIYIKENIDATVFMFALFKCRKSDKGRN